MQKLIRSVLVLASAVVVLFVMSCGGLLSGVTVHPMPPDGAFTGHFSSANVSCIEGCGYDETVSGIVDMVQTGDHVVGTFSGGGDSTAGIFEGNVQGDLLEFRWITSDSRQGSGYFQIQAWDGLTITGAWANDNNSRIYAWRNVVWAERPSNSQRALVQIETAQRQAEWQAREAAAAAQAADAAALAAMSPEDRAATIAARAARQHQQDEDRQQRAELEQREEEEGSVHLGDERGVWHGSPGDGEALRRRMEADSQASDERLRAGIAGVLRSANDGVNATLAESARHQQFIRDSQRQNADQQRQQETDRRQQADNQRADQQRQQADRQRQQADQQREQAEQQRQQAERQRVADVQQRVVASHASTPLGTSAPRDMTFCITMTVSSRRAGSVVSCGQYGEIDVHLVSNCTERVTCTLEFPGNEENNTTEVLAISPGPGGRPMSGPGDGTYQCYHRSAPSTSVVHATCHTTCTGGQVYRGMGICACPSGSDELQGLCYPACPSGSHRNYSNHNCDSD